MPSIFEKITRVVVQEMDTGGDMIAVRSIVEADRRHCFCLVREKRNLLGHRYYSTDLTLEDILEREESEGQLDKLDSGFQGQYEICKRWSARRLGPPTPAHTQVPFALNQINQSTKKWICTDVSTHLNLRRAQQSCKRRRGWGNMEISFSWKLFLNSLPFVFLPLLNNSLLN